MQIAAADDNSAWAVPCARSYQGGDWELAPIQSQEISEKAVTIGACSSSACTVTIPDDPGYVYYLITQDVQAHYAPPPASGGTASPINALEWYKRIAVNFMLQVTHGPTPDDVHNLSAAFVASASGAITHTPPALKQWVAQQLAVQPTLHRAYFRERVNPKHLVAAPIGEIFQPCDLKSRWRRFSLAADDIGSTLVLRSVQPPGGGAPVYALYVSGVLRTEVDPSALPRSCSASYCSTQPVVNTEYIICPPYPLSPNMEYIGAFVTLATTCERPQKTRYTPLGRLDIKNPALAFTVLTPPTVDANNVTLPFLDFADTDIELGPVDAPSTWPAKVPDGAIFLAPELSTTGPFTCPAGTVHAYRARSQTLAGSEIRRARFACSEAVQMAAQASGVRLSSLSTWSGASTSWPAGCMYRTDTQTAYLNTHAVGCSGGSSCPSAMNTRLVCVRARSTELGPWPKVQDGPPSIYVNNDAALLTALNVACPLTYKQQVAADGMPPFLRYKGLYYQFDPRLKSFVNTPESPAAEAIIKPVLADSCPNVPKTFLNADTCRIGHGCEPLSFTDQPVTLNATILSLMFTAGHRYVYAIDGLRLELRYLKSPCQTSRSRWLKLHSGSCGDNATSLPSYSLQLLQGKLESSSDVHNPYIRDILINSASERTTCFSDSGLAAMGATITADGVCWKHVQEDTFNVYDFTVWSVEHPGTRPGWNPITKPATDGETTMYFPQSHSMERWYQLRNNYMKGTFVGRLGDSLSFNELLGSVQTTGFAVAMGEIDGTAAPHPLVEVCGSPGETGSRPELGYRYPTQTSGADNFDRYSQAEQAPNRRMSINEVPSNVHAMVSVLAPDQLKQRVAFALSQIWVVAAVSANARYSERWLTYYDIMLRHSTGNLRDLMREVSYNPVMGTWLTFVNSQSFAYSGSKPDENYAREIMQLFSIGLWELNRDGTRKVDQDGNPIATYDNDDIVAFARTWTGFVNPLARGNIGEGATTSIDPMRLLPNRRDVFPKMDLYDGHIGDTLPLCNSLGERPFLRAGAHYTYLGTRPKPKWNKMQTMSDYHSRLDELSGMYVLAPNSTSSALYNKLCNKGPNGLCRFQSEVYLDAQLPCDAVSGECEVEDAMIIAITAPNVPHFDSSPGVNPTNGNLGICQGDCDSDSDCATGLICHQRTGNTPVPGCIAGSTRAQTDWDYCIDPAALTATNVSTPPTVYFEFVRSPCVSLAFFADGKEVVAGYQSGSDFVDTRQCADPTTEAAMAGCCRPVSNARVNDMTLACSYSDEMVTYQMALDRCEKYKLISNIDGSNPTLCTNSYWTSARNWQAGTPFVSKPGFYATASGGGCRIDVDQMRWSQTNCSVQVQVGADGMVNIINGGPFELYSRNKRPRMDLGGGNVFRVRWSDGEYPLAAANCSKGGASTNPCTLYDGQCVCGTNVVTSSVYTDANALPSLSAVEGTLRIGAASPAHFDSGTYSQCTTAACTAVVYKLHTRGSPTSPLLDGDAIFELQVNHSRTLYLRNLASTVHLAGGDFSFRNPPQFMSLQRASLRDAAHETEAVLDHLFYHENTAPFTVTRLIQNMVTSNPSPRYVAAVAEAFRTGVYGEMSFSNVYGDLAATVAAIVLDPEARSLVLHHDPSFGTVRDPIQKFYHGIRALQIVPDEGRELRSNFNLLNRIGMLPHHSPTVFNFFMPQFQPAGPATEAQLWAPAAQLGTMPFVVSLQSALASMARGGLRDCYNGFSYGGCMYYNRPTGLGLFTSSNATDVMASVAELSLLLTGGRLPAASLAFIAERYRSTLISDGAVEAMRVAQQLMMVTPAFHTNTEPGESAKTPPPPSPPTPAAHPYKAVVVLYLAGGADTFNFIVPHSGCGDGSTTSYSQYALTRTGAALPLNSLLPVDVPNGTQPCSTFGLHPELVTFQSLYNDGDASIMANVGNLVEPIETQAKFKLRTTKKPRSLYSHEHQQTASRTLHPQRLSANGILGRMATALTSGGPNQGTTYKTTLYSITGNTEMLRGGPEGPLTLSPTSGVVRYLMPQRANAEKYGPNSDWVEYELREADMPALQELLANVSGNVFAETSRQMLSSSLRDSESLGARVENATSRLKNTAWDQLIATDKQLAAQFYQVARLIASRDELNAERDIFYVDIGGWDTHNNVIEGVQARCKQLDAALNAFVTEMKLQGLWNDIVIQTSSDFARTLVFNGLGTDHSWGGNHFTFGGQVKGKKMHGRFPSLDLNGQSVVDARRGSLIPTTPWEGLWKPISQWFGVDAASLNEVLPNLPNFPGLLIPEKTDMFTH